MLPEFRDPAAGRFDLLSTVLAFVAVLPTVWGIKQFAEHGADWPRWPAWSAGWSS